MTQEAIREKRIGTLREQLPDTLTDMEKDAIAANNYVLEQALGITVGKPMTIEEADKQSANPDYVLNTFLMKQAYIGTNMHVTNSIPHTIGKGMT